MGSEETEKTGDQEYVYEASTSICTIRKIPITRQNGISYWTQDQRGKEHRRNLGPDSYGYGGIFLSFIEAKTWLQSFYRQKISDGQYQIKRFTEKLKDSEALHD
jgi:hypothetical protein